jgi:NADPH:quinone reductase-like Zn-dependent oxidoreductase
MYGARNGSHPTHDPKGDSMKAILRPAYGPPEGLELRDIPKPTPRPDEVLVQVQAAGVSMADVDYLYGRPAFARLITGLRRPRNLVLGVDVAGRVEAVGTEVTRFSPGDEVFGDLTEHGYGAFAEYACASERAFAQKPGVLSFEEAATVPQTGVMALQGFRGRRRITPGDRVLINGAGGNVGIFAVQIAKSFGAEVTAVDAAKKLDVLRLLGADDVIDYAEVDIVRSGNRYDHVLDVVADRSLLEWKDVLRPGGTYVMIPDSVTRLLQALTLGPLISLAGSRRMGMSMGQPFEPDDVSALTALIEAGAVRPVIDRRYRLDEVAEALRYQDEGYPPGKLVINL